ncbi:MAG: DUF308 domain-containing protein [Coriobacteriales bacterium]|nr:DUF308 domain-containing protein [Coriobacteriales bacterium]
MKIVSIILGILCVIAGGYCIFTPVETFGNLGWILGLFMIIDGIGSIVSYIEYRGAGKPSIWALLGGIASVILGVIVTGSIAMQFAIDFALAYLVAFWIIFGGICRIVGSFGLRKLYKAGDPLGRNWALFLILGILITIVGILCLIHPIFAAAGVGMLIAFAMISFGASFIIAAFAL